MKNIISILFVGLFLMTGSLILTLLGLNIMEAIALTIVLEVCMIIVSQYLPNNISLSSICGAISSNILFDCDYPMQSGTRDRAFIINIDDIDAWTYSLTNPLLVEGITLKAGKTAYQIDGRNNSIMPSFVMIKNAFTDVFDHIVSMKGFDISPDVKKNLTGMVSGKFIVITENVFKGATGNSAFEIYGITNGLELTALTRDPNNQDTQGAFDFTFATNKNKEPKIPATLFVTSYNDTKALVEGLL